MWRKKVGNIFFLVVCWFITFWLVIFAICSFAAGASAKSNVGNVVGLIFGIIFLLIAFLIVFFQILKPTYCPACKRFFALKELSTVETGREDISVKVENEIRDNSGNRIGTQDQYVAGERINYKTIFTCKKCGAEFYKESVKDKAKI